MSRVHDALARAAQSVAVAPPEVLPPGTVTANALEQYAIEGQRPLDRLEQYAAEGRPSLDLRETAHLAPAARAIAPAAIVPTGPPSRDFEGKVVRHNTGSTAAAQYTNLATVLHEAQLDRGLRSLLVTSAAPQEGKTLTVVNLATSLGALYARRVLIIDADLRRPSVHQALGIDAEAGLSDVLLRPGSPVPFIEVSPVLTVLPAGRPVRNPLVRLNHSGIEPLLAQCRSRFDWVLIDTPPVGTGADAQLLARFVQGVIFVIRAGAVPFPVVERAISELGRECIVGTVLNGVDERTVPSTSPYGRFASAG